MKPNSFLLAGWKKRVVLVLKYVSFTIRVLSFAFVSGEMAASKKLFGFILCDAGYLPAHPTFQLCTGLCQLTAFQSSHLNGVTL